MLINCSMVEADHEIRHTLAVMEPDQRKTVMQSLRRSTKHRTTVETPSQNKQRFQKPTDNNADSAYEVPLKQNSQDTQESIYEQINPEPIYKEIQRKSIRRRSTRRSKARKLQPEPIYDSVPTEQTGEIEIPSYEQRDSRKLVYELPVEESYHEKRESEKVGYESPETKASNIVMSVGEPVIDPPTAITPAQTAEAAPAEPDEQSESEYDSEEYSSYYSSSEEEIVVPKKKGFFSWGRK